MLKILVVGLCGNSLFYQKETKKLLHQEPGGKGYNQAVGIKKLGGLVTFCGAIGYDEHGKKCEEYLEKIKLNHHLFVKDSPTTFAKIVVDGEGNNFIEMHEGAKLDYDDLPRIYQLIDEHDIILLQQEIPRLINDAIIEYAFKHQKKIIVNPAPPHHSILKHLKMINLLTPNEEETRNLFSIPKEMDVINMGKYLLSINVENMIVTLGSKGLFHISSEQKNKKCEYYPSIKVKAVDTTGAGDILNASIAYGLAIHYSMEEAIKLGIVAAGISVTKPYVLDAYPTLLDIDQKKYSIIKKDINCVEKI